MNGSRALRGGAFALAGGYGGVQLAWAGIRHYENTDPTDLHRPGAMAYIEGAGLHFFDEGTRDDGIPLLLIHGFGGSTYTYRFQRPAFRGARRVITVDLPGFGLADRPHTLPLSHAAHAARLWVLLDRLGVERVTILGHSMGGGIALRMAASRPSQVDRLVLAASIHPNERPGPIQFPLGRQVGAVALALMQRLPALVRRSVQKVAYDPSYLTDGVWHGYVDPLRLSGTAACILKMNADVAAQPAIDPGVVKQPALLLWGETDSVVPLRKGHDLQRLLPNADIEVVPKAGHLVVEERPDYCNPLIERFING